MLTVLEQVCIDFSFQLPKNIKSQRRKELKLLAPLQFRAKY
jgi:hypothetical protein